MSGLHSSNVVLRIDVRGTTCIFENALNYHEQSNSGLAGFLETPVEFYGSDVSSIGILERAMDAKEPVNIAIITKSSAETGEAGGVIEDLGDCFIYKMQYLVPDFGKLAARFYFSDSVNCKWTMSLADIAEMRYQDKKTFDYATSDAMREVAAQIANLTEKLVTKEMN
jgi:hypothetical protein